MQKMHPFALGTRDWSWMFKASSGAQLTKKMKRITRWLMVVWMLNFACWAQLLPQTKKTDNREAEKSDGKEPASVKPSASPNI